MLMLTSSPPAGTVVPVVSTLQVPAWGLETRYDCQVASPCWLTSGSVVDASITSPDGLTRSVDTLPLCQFTETDSACEPAATLTEVLIVWP